MKLITLLTARKSLPLDNQDIDIQLKYKIVKFIKSTEADETFYRNEFAKIVNDCSEKDELEKPKTDSQGNVMLNSEKHQEFLERSNALSETEVDDIDFSLNLDEVAQLKLSVRQMLDLDIFIKEK